MNQPPLADQDQQPTALRLFWVTVAEQEQAENIARDLIDRRLAACVNILPGLRSCFFWQGQACFENEVGLLVKTSCHQQKACQERIIALHPYDLPCVIAVTPSSAHQPFADWVLKQTQDARLRP